MVRPIIIKFGINVLITKPKRGMYKDFYFPPVSKWWVFVGLFAVSVNALTDCQVI